MNRKNGYGVVTTNRLITVDKRGRTARHLEGRIRLDYMNENHYWVIVDAVQGMGDSFPDMTCKHDGSVTAILPPSNSSLPTSTPTTRYRCDRCGVEWDAGIRISTKMDIAAIPAEEDCGQIWIPDHMVASIRWYKQDW
jgi:hypothetical protein